MIKLIIIFIAVLFTFSIALSKRVVLDSDELKTIKEFYYSTDTILWYRDDISKLYIDKIYPNKDYIHSNIPKVRVVFDRDTIIDNEEIEICKFQVLNFEEMIVSPNSYDAWQTLWEGKFISGTFTELEELCLSGCYKLNNDKPFYAPNLRKFKCHENQLSSTIDLNSFPNLEELDFFMVWNNFDLTNLNLPKCKIFKLIGSNLSTTLNIDNMKNIEVFQIKDYYFNVWDYQQPGTINLKGSDIYKILEDLKNVKCLSLASTRIYGELPELDFPNLEYLELYGNNFFGKFPKLNTPKLKFLRMGKNPFEFISDTISLDSLEHFDIESTNIKSEVPVFQAPNLKYLNLRWSYFNGKLKKDMFKNNKLEYVNLQDNEFKSEIDFTIQSEYLKYLNLSSNDFIGKIPNIIAPNLFKLDLVRNMFDDFCDTLIVYPRTFVLITNNQINIKMIFLELCENAINQGFSNQYIYPEHIIEYNKHEEFDSLYGTLSDIDVFQKINYNDLTQRIDFEAIFNENTNKFELEDLDTNIFTYSVLKYVDNKWVESGLSIWDYVTEVGMYKIVAKSKYCDYAYEYPYIYISKLDVEDYSVDCSNLQVIDYFDMLGNKLYKSEIYNKQIIVRYKCLETGEIFHKLEIIESN